MKIRLRITAGLIAFVLIIPGCDRRQMKQTLESSQNSELENLVRLATKMDRENHPFEASQFYSVAIARGADEGFVLPKLALAQARSGLLLEARVSLGRLAVLAPDSDRIRELLLTISELLGGAGSLDAEKRVGQYE